MKRQAFAALRAPLRLPGSRRIVPGPISSLRPGLLPGLVLALSLVVGLFWAPAADAQSSRLAERRIDRSLAAKDAIRHRQMKRAYVAGAIAQHRRERIRDHYEDRYRRDRYYDDRRDDDDLSRVLIGVAVGAVATTIIMNSNQGGGAR